MSATYTNPVYDQYMADPFVLLHNGQYYAYGTGPRGPDGRYFRVLRSPNLWTWESVGWALIPPPDANDCWAPEVAYRDGIFHMYYSAQGVGGRDHQVRVAMSASPSGPFIDTGCTLVPDQPFTIDAHPFQDEDGQWYLFYARDFLGEDGDYRIGTGIVVDRMVDMLTLAGQPEVVIRPFADWQLFERQRAMYGGVYDWYTVEGAALRRHDGLYYCFYSGGAWERENYGISYVVADSPLGPYRRPQGIDGPLLRSVPGQVIGPGHNSFTVSLDGQQEYIVYHAWDAYRTARLMRIDRLTWNGSGPTLHGPTWTPQEIRPTAPSQEVTA